MLSREESLSFYDFFRCGLLHESHIKGFGQFSFDFLGPINLIETYLIVNPKALLKLLEDYFADFLDALENNEEAYGTFLARMKSDFADEISLARK